MCREQSMACPLKAPALLKGSAMVSLCDQPATACLTRNSVHNVCAKLKKLILMKGYSSLCNW